MITEEGIILGDTVLAKYITGEIRIDEMRVLALLSLAYGTVPSLSIIRKFHAAAKSYSAGDKVLALMHLALTGLPALENMEQARRISAAEAFLARGSTPLELLRHAGIEAILEDANASYLYKLAGGVSKAGFDPDEPRDEEGKWTDEGGEAKSSDAKWGRSHLLERHYKKHGASFGTVSEEEYTNKATEFYNRGQTENLPTKVDSYGVTRIYDPVTNTFGSYNSDGTVKTFFKPKAGGGYFQSQPGEGKVILEEPARGTMNIRGLDTTEGGLEGGRGILFHDEKIEPEG